MAFKSKGEKALILGVMKITSPMRVLGSWLRDLSTNIDHGNSHHGSRSWVPAMLRGYIDCIPSSWFHFDPAKAITGIWKVKQHMEVQLACLSLFLSLAPSCSASQIEKKKNHNKTKKSKRNSENGMHTNASISRSMSRREGQKAITVYRWSPTFHSSLGILLTSQWCENNTSLENHTVNLGL